MAKISIIVPVYNEEQELGRCVDENRYFFETLCLEVAGKYMIDICGPLLYCLWGNLYHTDIVQKHGFRFDVNLYVQEDVNFSFSSLLHQTLRDD